MFHFFFLPSADGGGGISFQMKQVFFHGRDVVHIDGEPVVTFEEPFVAGKDIGKFLVGVQRGNVLIFQMDHGVSRIVAIQG